MSPGGSAWRPSAEADALFSRALEGREAPWLTRFLSTVGRGSHRHGMIGPGARILIGVSGGKDSLSLALALALRRRRTPFPYELLAVTVDWTSFPAPPGAKAAVEDYMARLGIPFELRRADPADYLRGGELGCYACARARKRILFELARERGFGTVAFGHHLDDFAETLLMNLAFRGRFEPLAPVRDFGGGAIRVIRPLCEVRESVIRSLATRLELPVYAVDCPRRETNLRDRLAPIVADLAKMDTLVREKLYAATFDGGRSAGARPGGGEE